MNINFYDTRIEWWNDQQAVFPDFSLGGTSCASVMGSSKYRGPWDVWRYAKAPPTLGIGPSLGLGLGVDIRQDLGLGLDLDLDIGLGPELTLRLEREGKNGLGKLDEDKPCRTPKARLGASGQSAVWSHADIASQDDITT